jgi:ribosomal protein L11 methyltransferase
VDNDPQALEATLDNASRNGVAGLIDCLTPGACSENAVDILLANILAGPLVELAPRLLNSVKTGGMIVLSGILKEQAESVIAAYNLRVNGIHQHELDGWIRLDLLL